MTSLKVIDNKGEVKDIVLGFNDMQGLFAVVLTIHFQPQSSFSMEVLVFRVP